MDDGFDIFRHPGGSSSDWAASLPLGETVGMMGPGAKTGPAIAEPRDKLLIGDDETSAPAILRALGNLPQGTEAEIVLLVNRPEDRESVLSDTVSMKWLLRSEGTCESDLQAEMFARLDQRAAETRFWFAASRDAARAVRMYAINDAGLQKTRVHSVSYWS